MIVPSKCHILFDGLDRVFLAQPIPNTDNISGLHFCPLLLYNQNTFHGYKIIQLDFNPLNAQLNPICHLLALLGAHHIFHVSGIWDKINIPYVKSNVCAD